MTSRAAAAALSVFSIDAPPTHDLRMWSPPAPIVACETPPPSPPTSRSWCPSADAFDAIDGCQHTPFRFFITTRCSPRRFVADVRGRIRNRGRSSKRGAPGDERKCLCSHFSVLRCGYVTAPAWGLVYAGRRSDESEVKGDHLARGLSLGSPPLTRLWELKMSRPMEGVLTVKTGRTFLPNWSKIPLWRP